jgi:UDP-GlcNAc3NAcA epimerase
VKVATIVGARPQLIKVASVSRLLRSESSIKEVLIHTGQHYDDEMSQVFFEELDIPEPDYNLGVGSGSHGVQTGRMLERIEQVLMSVQPHWVLVYGDTNSTLAGALAASKLHTPLAHIEAGLRSFNRQMPEEINRKITDHLSDLLFAPTKTAVSNLASESIAERMVHLTGDVMYDAALHYAGKAESASLILRKLELRAKSYILTTVHRAENTDDPLRLKAIIDGLRQVAKEIPVVMPVHPRTRAALMRIAEPVESRASFFMIEPVGYLDMINLEKNAAAIATDSGGVQKESFFYQVPCITLRDETEWLELVELGWNRLVRPVSSRAVFEGIIGSVATVGQSDRPYGNGNAAQKILSILKSSL